MSIVDWGRARRPSARAERTLAAALGVAVVGGVGAWIAVTPSFWLRLHLKTAQFWSLEACLALGLALGVLVGRDLVRGLDRRDAVRAAALACLAVGLTLLVAPRTNRIFYDEQIYQAIGQNLADMRLAQTCNDGNVEYGRLQCWNGEYNKQPYAWPHLLSVAYRVAGVGPDTAFAINAAVMGATACGVYVLVILLFRDRVAASFAGLLIALMPQQLMWSATAAAEPSAALACVAALVAAAHYRRSGSTAALALLAVTAAYAMQFRPESLLILPALALLTWERVSGEIARPPTWWAGLLLVALAAVHVAHLAAVSHESWGATDARLSLRYVAANLAVNGRFYLADERFPVIFTLLALIGLAGRDQRTERASIVLHFVLFFGIYLLFYAGSYNYGADVRYSLMTYPPVAVLGGLGAARLTRWIGGERPRRWARAGVAAALAFQFLWYAPLVRATTEEAWAARADVGFARTLVEDLRGNSYVLTHNPGMFHVWGVNAGQMSLLVSNSQYLEYLVGRYEHGVYVHWNFWCNVQDPVQQALCQKVLATTALEPVREYRERDQRFVLYRVRASELGKSAPPGPGH